MRKNGEFSEIMRVGIILFAITALAALILAGVNMATAPVISEQNAQKIQKAMKDVLPNAKTEFAKMDLALPEDTCVTEIYESDAGFAVMASPKGYGGAISMVVGVDKNLTVTGISIISQSETAGLGANCKNETWQKQFVGKTEEISVVKNGATGNQIDAISSATITSKAVTKGVNDAIGAVKALGGDK